MWRRRATPLGAPLPFSLGDPKLLASYGPKLPIGDRSSNQAIMKTFNYFVLGEFKTRTRSLAWLMLPAN